MPTPWAVHSEMSQGYTVLLQLSGAGLDDSRYQAAKATALKGLAARARGERLVRVRRAEVMSRMDANGMTLSAVGWFVQPCTRGCRKCKA